MKALAEDLRQFPSTKKGNPLLIWLQGYRLRTKVASRPTVAKAGTFRGNRWPGLAIQYKRKTDGKVVHVWGGVKRLRAGHVTRAKTGFNAGIRTNQGGAKRGEGFGIVKKGQTFNTRNVLGRLKSNGNRYKRGDKQLGKAGGRAGMLGDWLMSDPVRRNNGKTIVVTSNKPYARKVAQKRPFHWGRTIERAELYHMDLVADEWMSDRLRRRFR